ncbi:MAG: hypothetical protein AB7U35_12190 [Sphingobium sp.]
MVGTVRSLILSCLAIAGLAACAGPIKTDLHSLGPGMADTGVLAWASAPTGNAAPVLDEARQEVSGVLVAKGFGFSDVAPYSVSLGLSERPGDMAVAAEDGVSLSPAKRRRLLQDCEDRIFRLRVTIVDRATGLVRYDGAAEEAHCKAGLNEVLPRLARLAVADLAQPRGEHRILSRGRD